MCIYTNYYQTIRKKNLRSNPLTIASKMNKISRNKFDQGAEIPENSKTLIKENEGSKKWKDSHAHELGELIALLPKAI